MRARGLFVSGGGGAAADDVHRRASVFFLGWLVLAASMSLAGNVCHALLIAPTESRWLAAFAALVPPVVLLAATHSASWLVRARSAGGVYRASLALTAALAAGSFALSFDALRSFAVMLGIRDSLAWIWPAVIDVAIAHATLCLLSLNRDRRGTPGSGEDAAPCPGSVSPDEHDPVLRGEQLNRNRVMPAGQTTSMVSPRGGETERCADDRGEPVAASPRPESAVSDEVGPAGHGVAAAAAAPGTPGADPRLIGRSDAGPAVSNWMPVAELLVRDGVTSKSAPLVATILAENAAGTPPSTIGRRHKVHHTTVSRIFAAAEQLVRASAGT